MQTLKEKLEILLAATSQTPPSVEIAIDNAWNQYSVESALKFALEDYLIRPLDPYRDLKEAHAAGKVIQAKRLSGGWFDLNPDWTLPADQYRIKSDAPWSLAAHVTKFFRPLRDGEAFHREDWTADMLPDGCRPLLFGERPAMGEDEVTDYAKSSWTRNCSFDARQATHLWLRTKRPLPEPKKRVPLGPKDIPPGSVFRPKAWGETPSFVTLASVRRFAVVFNANDLGKHLCDQGKCTSTSWPVLMEQWQIKRPGEDWQPCSKEISA